MLKFLSQKNIKTHLILVVLMVFIVLLLFILFIGQEKYKEIKEQYKNDAQQAVSIIANNQKQAYNSTFQLLNIISYLPEVSSLDTNKLNLVFSSILLKKKDNYVMLLATNGKGKAISTAKNSVILDISDRKYYKDIVNTGKFSIGEYAFSRITGFPVLHYALPVFKEKDLNTILIASYSIENFSDFIDSKKLTSGSTITITDHKGSILYTTDSIGKPGLAYSYFLKKDMTENTGILYHSDDKSRKYMDYYCKMLDEAGKPYMYIYYSIPLEKINNKAIINLFRNILLLIVISGFILIIIWMYVEDNILKNLEKILKTISQFEKGNYNARTEVNYTMGDMGKLAQAIDSLAYNIERRDIEQRMTETFLKKMTDRYEIALNSALIGVWDWNLLSDNMQWHENMFRIFGLSNKNMSVNFKTWESMLHAEDVSMCNIAIKQSIANKSRLKIQYRIIRPDGDIRYIRCIADIVVNNSGKAERMVGVNWDTTERVEMENELLKAKKKAEESDKLKSIFLANMSHELRTPLNAILGFASLINSDDITIERIKEYNKVILDNSHNLNQIIGTILDISIIENGKMTLDLQKVNINNLINELIFNHNTILSNSEKPQLVIKSIYTETETIINVDEMRLKQIINNLISNAIKFTDNGTITIKYEIQRNYILFSVSDTGIGISKDDQTHIFDRFKQVDEGFSRNYGGTGLGLSISKSLVDLMGGKIWLDSTLGLGSTFFFTIPVR